MLVVIVPQLCRPHIARAPHAPVMTENVRRDAEGELKIGHGLRERGEIIGHNDVPESDWGEGRDERIPQRACQRQAGLAVEGSQWQDAEHKKGDMQQQITHEPRPPCEARRLRGYDVHHVENEKDAKEHDCSVTRGGWRLHCAAQDKLEIHRRRSANTHNPCPARDDDDDEERRAYRCVLPQQLAGRFPQAGLMDI
eukprot:CAMPEP_0119404684 /NCGR_PEP_ID=MMETSP1334-20130426/144021_1 /TAXON_ID=127549 /ORGANISM="Calcidiscus leptoporus, Strain RCC1130" /LENGTH=195 /DNA_ID=CAMNT_0007428655 /DNA_START=853 /DNA_END=1440 /DNA_ORIENTATION=-